MRRPEAGRGLAGQSGELPREAGLVVEPAGCGAGFDYLLQLGTWRPVGGSADLAGHVADDDRWWAEHYGVEHDPSGLSCEANALRYLPHPDVIVRIGDGATGGEVARVLAAARRCGVGPRVSRLLDEDDASFAASLSDHRFGRIRAVCTVGDEVRRAAIAAEVDLVDEAVTASGRLELRWYLREQAVSRTLHRFGNLVGAEGG
ncbi:MAG: hypothetical protein QF739_08795 [Acidimicrobiales bacterium]|jgi:RHH-type proline utilization regulon transcriptional repressor/proline dehydrogenase/delta 1-pyrroline-5-carboxylate dehydrogenase|nr:hypothetical protein [Acidimicrobiales bacterium]